MRLFSVPILPAGGISHPSRLATNRTGSQVLTAQYRPRDHQQFVSISENVFLASLLLPSAGNKKPAGLKRHAGLIQKNPHKWPIEALDRTLKPTTHAGRIRIESGRITPLPPCPVVLPLKLGVSLAFVVTTLTMSKGSPTRFHGSACQTGRLE